jgi:hypothetical protein
LLIGERGSYGLATGMVDLVLGRTRSSAIISALKGKFAGARLWVGGRGLCSFERSAS